MHFCTKIEGSHCKPVESGEVCYKGDEVSRKKGIETASSFHRKLKWPHEFSKRSCIQMCCEARLPLILQFKNYEENFLLGN